MISLARSYGYFGVFLALLISNASILFPLPGIFIIFLAGTVLNPLGVAVAGGLGAAAGELTGYIVGRGGHRIVGKRSELQFARRMFKKYGVWTIYFFAATPTPFDIAGILSGVLKIEPLVFFILTFAGKTTAYTIYAYSGREVTDILISMLSGRLDVYGVLFITAVVALILGVLVYWKYLVSNSSTAK